MERHYNLDDFEQAWSDEPEKICDPGVRHDPSEIMKRNAAFLLESSRKINSYDRATLSQMQSHFDQGQYSRVIELAYQHDRVRREAHPFSPNQTPQTPLTRVRQFVASVLRFLK